MKSLTLDAPKHAVLCCKQRIKTRHVASVTALSRGIYTAMGIIETRLDRSSPDFQENTNYFQQLLDQLNERIRQVQQGGGEDATAIHRKRNKLPARERIQLLWHPDTPFLELSPLAAWAMYDNEAPSAGIVTGIEGIWGR